MNCLLLSSWATYALEVLTNIHNPNISQDTILVLEIIFFQLVVVTLTEVFSDRCSHLKTYFNGLNLIFTAGMLICEVILHLFSLIVFSIIFLFIFFHFNGVSIVVISYTDEEQPPPEIQLNNYITETKIIEEECPICLSSNDVQIVLTCGHHYHKMCLSEWTKNHSNCPVCRFEFQPQ